MSHADLRSSTDGSQTCWLILYINVMQLTAPTQNVGEMLRAAKKPAKALESAATGNQVISEAAASSCEISYRSYCEKAKRHRRGLSALEGRAGRTHRSRSATPELELETEAPVRSRTRLDADGDRPCTPLILLWLISFRFLHASSLWKRADTASVLCCSSH